MKVIVAGNNEVASSVLEGLIEMGENVVGVFPEGKDIVKNPEYWERPFLPVAEQIAKENDIPCYVGNINKFHKEIRELNPDLIASCRGIFLVKPIILDIPKIGTTNLHYGELPRYGGCATLQWAILNGEGHIGVTLHYMTESFDSGPIIDQRKIDISKQNRRLRINERDIEVTGLTAFETYLEANKVASRMFLENYPSIKSKNVRTTMQNPTNKSYYTSDMINFAKDKYIDLEKKSDEEISRHVRAFTFPPKQMPIGKLNGNIYGELILR